MEFFRNTNIDFMKYRRAWILVSLVLNVIAIIAVFVQGHLNIGIDFSGGTQVTVKFDSPPEIDDLRRVMNEAGIVDAQIQRFGDEEDNEALIKTSVQEQQEEGLQGQVLTALNNAYGGGAAAGFDLNQRGTDALADLLFEADPDQIRLQDDEIARNHYDQVARDVLDVRRREGLLTSWDQIQGLASVTPEAMAALQNSTDLGRFSVLGIESVGPQIGSELRRKGIMAVALSLLGMLAYIWIRFELRYGIGAVVASAHDVLIVLGLFALAGFQFDLTTVAAFLTLVGYSVNDTVVVFDRVRENLRRTRREPLVDVMNRSLNQTLSRTVLTSGTTLLAVGSLFFLGGEVLRGFGFILTVGIIVGTYSSIYIASPFALLWERVSDRLAQRSK